MSLATERLVQDSLPLLPSTVQGVGHQDQSIVDVRLAEVLEPFLARSAMNLPDTGKVVASSLRERLHSHSYMSHRQRLVASLGGPKALARLYVSYARLHLPSLASNRSPLAFPYGQLTSPFVSGGQGVQHPAGNLRRRLSPNATSRRRVEHRASPRSPLQAQKEAPLRPPRVRGRPTRPPWLNRAAWRRLTMQQCRRLRGSRPFPTLWCRLITPRLASLGHSTFSARPACWTTTLRHKSAQASGRKR